MKSLKQTKNLIIAGALILVVGGTSVGGITYHNYREQVIEDQTKVVYETVSEDVSTYLGKALDPYIEEIKTLSKTNTGTQTDEFTEEQKKNISAVAAASSSDILSTVTKMIDVSESKSLQNMETKLQEEINTILDEGEVTASLSNDDREVLTDSITTIVENNVLKTLQEKNTANSKNIAAVQSSVNSKMDEMENKLKTYDDKISQQEARLESLSKENSSNSGSNTELNAKLAEVQSTVSSLNTNYETFKNSALTVTNIVSSVDGETTNGVLSASVGSDLNAKITAMDENFNQISNSANSLAAQISGVSSTVDALGSDLNETKASIGTLGTDLEAAKTSLKAQYEEAIKTSDDATATKIQGLISEIEATQSDITTLSSNVLVGSDKDALEAKINSDVQSISNNLSTTASSLDTKIGSVNDTLTNSLNSLATSLTNYTQSTDSTISTIQSEVTELKGKATLTYTYDAASNTLFLN